MEVVRKIHNMPEIPGNFNVFRIIADYAEIARRYQVKFPQNFNSLIEHMQAAEKALEFPSVAPCPCHNDLLNANFLTNSQLHVLDWEYAGMGDLFFDLANFSDHHQLTDEQDRWLLKCYFEEVTSKPVGALENHENHVRSARGNLGACSDWHLET